MSKGVLSAARPGTDVVTAGPLRKDWAFDGMSLGGRECADGPITVDSKPIEDLHVRLTSRSRGLTRTIAMSAGTVPQSAGVIVFPQDRKSWASRRVLYSAITMTRSGGYSLVPASSKRAAFSAL